MRLVKFLRNQGLYLIGSLVLSISLFVYVSSTNQGSQNNQIQQQNNSGNFLSSLASQRKAKVNLPLQLDVNDIRYFVTGAPESVTVQLSGPSALVTAAVNTKNFEVYANLRDLTLGNHTVALKVRGLSKDISFQIIPSKISINLAQRATRNIPVKVQYNTENIADGYDIGNAKSSIQTVQITGAAEQVARVQQVVAQLAIPNNTKKTINQRVQLQALDSNGNLVDVVMTPQITNVTLPITPGNGKKSVPVQLKAIGSNANGYTLTANVNEVSLFGKQQVLNTIKQVIVQVDVSGITTNTTKKVDIQSFEGVKQFEPTTIMVNIQPKATQTSTDSSTSSTSSASSASSSSSINNKSSTSSIDGKSAVSHDENVSNDSAQVTTKNNK
ncbi:CdaR family protein [Periweissella fabalis]|uniref:Cell surface protein n=1 Tax=Periweissella fabalis TaxID=1070421 RepID=A0A7X6S3P4_9LACO|nr:CdaR family protein [Periweissella fabalis]MCM0598222.1 cell surface protein [Periweissella fabalis]NKZ24843.1 cell surface protein [Periweissella fabalis]